MANPNPRQEAYKFVRDVAAQAGLKPEDYTISEVDTPDGSKEVLLIPNGTGDVLARETYRHIGREAVPGAHSNPVVESAEPLSDEFAFEVDSHTATVQRLNRGSQPTQP